MSSAKAEELLSKPNRLIFEVAYEMGFSSEGNFTNWFKKLKRMTPTEIDFKNKNGKHIDQTLALCFPSISVGSAIPRRVAPRRT